MYYEKPSNWRKLATILKVWVWGMIRTGIYRWRWEGHVISNGTIEGNGATSAVTQPLQGHALPVLLIRDAGRDGRLSVRHGPVALHVQHPGGRRAAIGAAVSPPHRHLPGNLLTYQTSANVRPDYPLNAANAVTVRQQVVVSRRLRGTLRPSSTLVRCHVTSGRDILDQGWSSFAYVQTYVHKEIFCDQVFYFLRPRIFKRSILGLDPRVVSVLGAKPIILRFCNLQWL